MRYLDEAAAFSASHPVASTAAMDTEAAVATAAKSTTSGSGDCTKSILWATAVDAGDAVTSSLPSSGTSGCAKPPSGAASAMNPNLITTGGHSPVFDAPANPASLPRLTGRQYYEGLCIKAVNQCVGRVIRHARDYATIVLVDARYMPQPRGVAKVAHGSSGEIAYAGTGGGVVSALPTWIQQSLQTGTGDFPHVYSNLVRFFRGRIAAAEGSGGNGSCDRPQA
ncbi:hypothetical protein Vafri_2140 [Volvox africanus]|nr:hypothetical protein Vafri_2140 [Volvox africanus]